MEHPIDCLMNSVMHNLRGMLDVDTIVGKPIETKEGTVIVPVSKVSFGFAVGGSEFTTSTLAETKKRGLEEESKNQLPFGGGSAAGVNITPVGFLVISETGTKILPVEHLGAFDKVLDYVPDIVDKLTDMMNKEKTYTYEFYEEDMKKEDKED